MAQLMNDGRLDGGCGSRLKGLDEFMLHFGGRNSRLITDRLMCPKAERK